MMIIEYMKPEDAIQVSSLVWSTFAELEAPGYKQEGIDEWGCGCFLGLFKQPNPTSADTPTDSSPPMTS